MKTKKNITKSTTYKTEIINDFNKKGLYMNNMYIEDFKNEGLKIPLTYKQAKLIQFFICEYFEWPVYNLIFSNQIKRRVRGHHHYTKKHLLLYGNGQNLFVLLHELAHHCGFRYNHGRVFKAYFKKIIRIYKENEKKIFGMTLAKFNEEELNPKPKVVEKFAKVKKNILEEIECEVINKTLHIKHVGRVLVEYGLNNLENLKFIETTLYKKGITIKRG